MAPMTFLNKLSYDKEHLSLSIGEPWAIKTVNANWSQITDMHVERETDNKGKTIQYIAVEKSGQGKTLIPVQIFLSPDMANEVLSRYRRGGESASAAPQGDDTATMLAKAIKAGGLTGPDAQRIARAAFSNFSTVSPNVQKLKEQLVGLGVQGVVVTLHSDWKGADVELADRYGNTYNYHAKGPEAR
jgi:hypothetical protein